MFIQSISVLSQIFVVYKSYNDRGHHPPKPAAHAYNDALMAAVRHSLSRRTTTFSSAIVIKSNLFHATSRQNISSECGRGPLARSANRRSPAAPPLCRAASWQQWFFRIARLPRGVFAAVILQ